MNPVAAGASQSERHPFAGALVVNAHRISRRKSIIICGVTRSGTSFGASVFVRLGVPFLRPGERELSGTYEHRQLKAAFLAGEFETVSRLAADFSSRFPVWGWKLPAIHGHFELIGRCVPNPHFVMLFKEPLSVAARKNAQKGGETLGKMVQVLTRYRGMAALAENTQHPCMLISYDRAMTNLETFIAHAASYAGVPRFDATAVAAGIHEDQRRYLVDRERGRQRRTKDQRHARPAAGGSVS